MTKGTGEKVSETAEPEADQQNASEAQPCDAAAIARRLRNTFPDVYAFNSEDNADCLAGSTFFFVGAERMFPFATLVTSDEHDQASDLTRPNVFRLNIGLSKPTFLALFGAKVPRAGEDGLIASGFDYTTLDQIMPHPVYGNMYWVCVLNPGAQTLERVHELLAEAYGMAADKNARSEAHTEPTV